MDSEVDAGLPAASTSIVVGAMASTSISSQLLAIRPMGGMGDGSGFLGRHLACGVAASFDEAGCEDVEGIGREGSGKTRGGSGSTGIPEPGIVSPRTKLTLFWRSES